ncbi:MAG: response regulator [Candidatus Aminicenantes bacterium]
MKKESMLVVEDEDIMREALVDYFSGGGHKVDTANDGDNALTKLNLEDYDVMIIDLRLPGRDGLSVLKEVRAKNPKTKVIIITAYPSYESKMEALRWGAVDYLAKPFELNHLEDLITQPYEVDVVPAPQVEEPTVEEEIVTPCIWMQAGIVKKRMCTHRYECLRGCDFFVAMMKKEKFKNDPRIKPYLEKVYSLLGRNQCRYTLSGELSFRDCTRLYNCASCELDQMVQHKIEQQIALKNARRKRKQTERLAQVTMKKKPIRTDH